MTETKTEINFVNSPYCRELRSKKYYFLPGVPTVEKDLLDGSNHCWCRHTSQAIGPDGELVQPVDCSPSRKCYRSLFDERE
jgi:hypothetical protein